MLANEWASRGHTVSVLTMESEGTEHSYQLSDVVSVRQLDTIASSHGAWNAVINNVRRVRVLRSAIINDSPDVVVSFMDQTNVLVTLACLRTGIPVVCCEHTVPGLYQIGRIWEGLRRLVYPWADSLVFMTQGARDTLPWIKKKSVAIPNALPALSVGEEPIKLAGPLLACLGRLSAEKQYDLFLQAFYEALKHCPQWRAVMIGDGPERNSLENLAETLGIADRIYFVGMVDNVADYLVQAEMLVHSAQFEGFGNALCEAMSFGLPVVAFDCPVGPREIIRHGVDGLLVPPDDVVALSQAMVKLMQDEPLRKHMGTQAIKVAERFSMDSVMQRWDVLLNAVISSKKKRNV